MTKEKYRVDDLMRVRRAVEHQLVGSSKTVNIPLMTKVYQILSGQLPDDAITGETDVVIDVCDCIILGAIDQLSSITASVTSKPTYD